MVSVLTCLAAGIFFFRAFNVRYLSANSVIDVPVEAMFPKEELYVNWGSPAWHNQYRHTTGRAIVPDATSVISKYGCSQQDGIC